MTDEKLMAEHKALNPDYEGSEYMGNILNKQVDILNIKRYSVPVMAKSMTRFDSRKPQGVQAPNHRALFLCSVAQLAGYAWEPLGSPESLRPVCQPHIARFFLFDSIEGGGTLTQGEPSCLN